MERRLPRGVVPVWRDPTTRLSWQLCHGRPLRATLAPGAGPGTAAAAVVAEPHHQLLTARQAAWLVVRRAEQRDAEEAQQLAQLRAQHPEVAEAIALTQDFAHLVRQRQGEQLDAWLARVAQSPIRAL